MQNSAAKTRLKFTPLLMPLSEPEVFTELLASIDRWRETLPEKPVCEVFSEQRSRDVPFAR